MTKLPYTKSGRLMWQTARQYGGLEWAWELLNPADKTWKLHVRPRGNPGLEVKFDVPGEMMNDGSVLVALLATAQRKIVTDMQERVERINEQRRIRRELQLREEQERAVQTGSLGESGGQPQEQPGEARGESTRVPSNREGSSSADSESNLAGPSGVQSESEAPARKASRPRKRSGRSASKNSHSG